MIVIGGDESMYEGYNGAVINKKLLTEDSDWRRRKYGRRL